MPHRRSNVLMHFLLPLFLILLYVPAIVDYPVFDCLKLYAIIDCVLCLATFCVYLWECNTRRSILTVYSAFKVINYGLGLAWFEKVLGDSIFLARFTKIQRELLLVQIIYMELWTITLFYAALFISYRQRIIDHYTSLIEIWIQHRKLKKASAGQRMRCKGWVLAQKVCTICEEEYGEESDLYILDCGHSFHALCLQRWEGYAIQTCPNCRAVVSIAQ